MFGFAVYLRALHLEVKQFAVITWPQILYLNAFGGNDTIFLFVNSPFFLIFEVPYAHIKYNPGDVFFVEPQNLQQNFTPLYSIAI